MMSTNVHKEFVFGLNDVFLLIVVETNKVFNIVNDRSKKLD